MPTKKPDPEGKVLSKDPTKGKKKPAAPKKRKPHYVDNKKFLESIIVYKNKVKEAEASGNTEPRIDEYLGECFLKIATHLSFRPNFINYMYKDDMIADEFSVMNPHVQSKDLCTGLIENHALNDALDDLKALFGNPQWI